MYVGNWLTAFSLSYRCWVCHRLFVCGISAILWRLAIGRECCQRRVAVGRTDSCQSRSRCAAALVSPRMPRKRRSIW